MKQSSNVLPTTIEVGQHIGNQVSWKPYEHFRRTTGRLLSEVAEFRYLSRFVIGSRSKNVFFKETTLSQPDQLLAIKNDIGAMALSPAISLDELFAFFKSFNGLRYFGTNADSIDFVTWDQADFKQYWLADPAPGWLLLGRSFVSGISRLCGGHALLQKVVAKSFEVLFARRSLNLNLLQYLDTVAFESGYNMYSLTLPAQSAFKEGLSTHQAIQGVYLLDSEQQPDETLEVFYEQALL